MFEAVVASGIEPAADHEPTIDIHGYGLPESRAAELLGPLLDRDRKPLVGIKVSWSILTASVRGSGVEAVAEEIERLWHPLAYGRGESTLEGVVGGLLQQRGATIATMALETWQMLLENVDTDCLSRHPLNIHTESSSLRQFLISQYHLHN